MFVIRTIMAGGWLANSTWRHLAFQGLLAGLFSMLFFVWPPSHFGLLVPATIHALILGGWILRNPLRKVFLHVRVAVTPIG
jgi:hypothetical protein